MFADLIDGPLAHMPSGRFGANSAWILCAAIAHNLLRAAGALAGGTAHRGPRCDAAAQASSTSPPDWPARNDDPILHLPTHWPWAQAWLALWHNTIGHSPPQPATA